MHIPIIGIYISFGVVSIHQSVGFKYLDLIFINLLKFDEFHFVLKFWGQRSKVKVNIDLLVKYKLIAISQELRELERQNLFWNVPRPLCNNFCIYV